MPNFQQRGDQLATKEQIEVPLPVPSFVPVTTGLVSMLLNENQNLILKSFEEITTTKNKNMVDVVGVMEKVH